MSNLVSVIVLNWNGKRYLNECLSTLLSQTYSNYEVLLVDNCSTDDSIKYVEAKFGRNPKLRIITFNNNYGFSKGNNLALKFAKGKYIIFMNNDTAVKPEFISELTNMADSDETIGSVSCKILLPNGKLWFGQYFMHNGLIVPFFTQSLLSSSWEEIYDKFTLNLANSGCAVLYRKDVLDKSGGFDEDFWADWEDYDLGFRINIAGYKSVYIPSYLCLHIGGGSFGFSPDRLTRIYRNMLWTYAKNYEIKNIVIRFPVIAFIFLPLYHFGWLTSRLLFSFSDFNKCKGITYFFSLIKCYIQFMQGFRIIAKKRYLLRYLRRTKDETIFKNTCSKAL